MDKRDKIDQKLADRFQSMEMEPDAAIWSRIDASLDASLDAANIVAPHRRRGRILRLTASVASVAALLLLSMLLFQREDVATELPNIPNEIVRTVATVEDPIIENQPIKTKNVIALAPQTRSKSPKKSRMSTPKEAVATKESNQSNESDQSESDQSEPDRKDEKPVVTKSVFSKQRTAVVEKEPIERSFKQKRREMNINVSGSANFASSVSGNGTNSWVKPLRMLDDSPLYYGSHLVRDREWKHNMPLSFGVTIQKMITRKIGVETGVVYTYLSSTSDGTNLLDQDVKQRLHYIGVPVNLVYSVVSGKRFGLYAKAGVLVDTPISAVGISYFEKKQVSEKLETKGVQVTSMVQLGGEYIINRMLSLYVEPTLNYYHKSNQPISFRTENDFAFSAQVGIRFKL